MISIPLFLIAIIYWQLPEILRWSNATEGEHTSLPILDDVINFSRPNNCNFVGDDLAKIFNEIRDNSSVSHPAIGTFLVEGKRPEKNLAMKFARIEGYWEGLHVSRLVYQGYDESDDVWFEVRFLEPPGKVAAVFKKKGFRIRGIGVPTEIDGDYGACQYGVYALPGGSTFLYNWMSA